MSLKTARRRRESCIRTERAPKYVGLCVRIFPQLCDVRQSGALSLHSPMRSRSIESTPQASQLIKPRFAFAIIPAPLAVLPYIPTIVDRAVSRRNANTQTREAPIDESNSNIDATADPPRSVCRTRAAVSASSVRLRVRRRIHGYIFPPPDAEIGVEAVSRRRRVRWEDGVRRWVRVVAPRGVRVLERAVRGRTDAETRGVLYKPRADASTGECAGDIRV